MERATKKKKMAKQGERERKSRKQSAYSRAISGSPQSRWCVFLYAGCVVVVAAALFFVAKRKTAARGKENEAKGGRACADRRKELNFRGFKCRCLLALVERAWYVCVCNEQFFHTL